LGSADGQHHRGALAGALQGHGHRERLSDQHLPNWNFDEVTFDCTPASFGNPDYVSIVIHNHRWRLSVAAGAPHYDAMIRGFPDGASNGSSPNSSQIAL
jgi:hypothetical protein